MVNNLEVINCVISLQFRLMFNIKDNSSTMHVLKLLRKGMHQEHSQITEHMKQLILNSVKSTGMNRIQQLTGDMCSSHNTLLGKIKFKICAKTMSAQCE